MVVVDTPPIPHPDEILQEQLDAGKKLASPPAGEEIVISGLAGRFPDSKDVHHFRDNLFQKVDMVNERNSRWNIELPGLPLRSGKTMLAEKFDCAFFGMHHQQGHAADPSCRMLLEKAVECVMDAGVNPADLRGSKTGIFIGACNSESENIWYYKKSTDGAYGITTTCRAMLASRISYYLGTIGPSFVLDSACSSSLYAMDMAYKSLRDGHCDAALVGGSNFCLYPFLSHCFALLGVLSPNGMCKPFDEDANGYARSEAVAMVYLQKAKDAKRIYATIVHSKSNCDGYKAEGITFPGGQLQRRLLKEVYNECGVDPLEISYMEAHGTGTKVGDPEELDAIDQVFCKNRATPLPIGSVKSNIGHSEPSSGLCSITKVILAMETGIIPPNIHFDKPKQSVDALMSGRLKVITEKTPWTPGYVGVNSFGFGGANCHVLLKPNPKVKRVLQKSNLPHIVAVSGRSEEAVNFIFDELARQEPTDPDFVGLLHNIFAKPIPGHKYRGYIILKDKDHHLRDVQLYTEMQKPVWFLFSGVACHWSAMAQDLLKVPVFEAAVQRCHVELLPYGVDLKHILTDTDTSIFQDIVNISVGTVAVQIGLVDVLTTLGITADGIVGHSIGEISGAYADGCLDTKQAILAAYWRGIACRDCVLIKGSMATVGLRADQTRALLDSEIDIACHDAPDHCTISGPANYIQKAVTQLRAQGVLAQEIECGGIPLHSRYVQDAGKKFMKSMLQLIPRPKQHSAKWTSSSVNEDNFSSAQYHTNNLLKPVLFHEAVRKIPSNAAVIEISPSGVLHSSFKSEPQTWSHSYIPLSSCESKDNTDFLLGAIGRLFELGLQPQLQKLYPEVEFPVSRGTPMIGPLIRWNHSSDWFVLTYDEMANKYSGESNFVIDMSDAKNKYLQGHIIDGRNLFPATGYLFLAWNTLAQMMGLEIHDISVVFENVRFMRATNLPKDGSTMFTVMVQKASKQFEVAEGGVAIVTGQIYVVNDPDREMTNIPPVQPSHTSDLLEMKSKDIYKELRLRGYNYSGMFRGLVSAENMGRYGKAKWVGNWVAFMDSILQIQILQEDTRGLFVPTTIERVVINLPRHNKLLEQMSLLDSTEGVELPVSVCRESKVIQAGGVEIRCLRVSAISRRKRLGIPVLEKHQFIPHFAPIEPVPTLQTVLRICIHLLLENTRALLVHVAEVVDTPVARELAVLAPHIAEVLGDLPLVQPRITVFTKPGAHTHDLGNVLVQDGVLRGEGFMLVIASDVLSRHEHLQTIVTCLVDGGCLLARERTSQSHEFLPVAGLTLVFDQVVDGERIILMRKVKDPAPMTVVHITEKNFSWLSALQAAMANKSAERVLLVAQNEPLNGIMGLVNCLHNEPGGKKVRCVFIQDQRAPPFDPEHPLYKTQLTRDLLMNVYRDGEWGSYRHLALEECPTVVVPHGFVNVTTPGDLSSFRWLEGPLNPNTCQPDVKEKLIQVYFSALNFRDVMTATGKLQADVVAKDRLNLGCVQGFEFAGRNANGKRVMGMIAYGALANVLVMDPGLTWDVPDQWSLEDAATIPVVYGTAYYALNVLGRFRQGESILIHAGSGGVGQAAINISLHEGLTVYTTVGTKEKRDFIKHHFPQIPDNHIFNSRDITFEKRLMEETAGRGVNLVLNSLAEEKLQASVRCLARGGRFLEIGKFDLANNNPLGMQFLLSECSYQAVMLDNLFTGNPKTKKLVHDILMQGIKKGAVRPLTRTVFKEDEVEQAFRYMAAGKHIGKVLVKIRSEEPEKVLVPVPRMVNAVPRLFCNPHSTYIIVGGLGGFGLELADWLVLRGARNLVLTSRRGISTGYQSYRIRTWRSYGTQVEISTDDVTSQTGVETLLKRADALAPVEGIFNLAVVLQDALLENQTEEKFATSAGPKAVATRLLDAASRILCPHLRHFVVFSSVSCGRGNAGQTNYGMSNSVMERVCEKRWADGLPSLAVQWGAVGEVGLVAEMQEEQHEIEIGGTLQQTISSCLSVMDEFLRQTNPVVGSMVVAEKRTSGGVAGTMVDCVANIMGIINMKTVNLHATLSEIGMDSMMAVEIIQTLEREYEVFLTPQDIRGMTFAKLHEIQAAGATEDVLFDGTSTGKVDDRATAGLALMLRVAGPEQAIKDSVITLPSQGSGPTVVMVPGVEGVAAAMEPLARNMPTNVSCLQLQWSEQFQTVHEMVQHLLPHTKSAADHDPFLLLGYSFGGLLVLELAMALQSQGRASRVVLIDTAPEMIGALTAFWSQGSDDILQINIITTILMVICRDQYIAVKDTLVPELHQLTTWHERIGHALRVIPPLVYSEKYSYLVATSMYQRVKAATQYRWTHDTRLECPVLLLRPNKVTADIGSEDFGLHKICKNVEVHRVDGDHVTILDNPETAVSATKFLRSGCFVTPAAFHGKSLINLQSLC